MGKKKQRESDGEQNDAEDFNLQMVIDLGGNKKDFEFLNNLKDGDEDIDDSDDLDTEPIKKDDIRQFIQELGFSKVMDFIEEPSQDDKKPKLLSRPLDDEERAELEASQSQATKKSKNKFKVQDSEVSSSSDKPQKLDCEFLGNEPKRRKYLLIKTGRKWQETQVSKDPTDFDQLDEKMLEIFSNYAAKLFENEVKLYHQQQEGKKSSSANWMKTVLSSGTLSDKSAALTLLVQDAPVHNLKSLETLVSMCSKKRKNEALSSLDTLKELFLNELLLDRKLKTFEQHPFSQINLLSSGNHDSRDRRLVLWYFEAQLKKVYEEFINSIQVITHDTVPAVKKKALVTTFDLLVNTPEQEKVLLANLVNKLGDPERKVASKAAYLLKCLVDKHPNMKFVVVLEVERLMYRPNIAAKAQYYGVCFLNQLVLNKKEKDLPSRLIDIYFSFFKVFVKKGEVDSKMLSALLTGVNRTYPFVKGNKEKIEESMNTLYRIVHIVNFNTSIQALMLLYQVMDSSENISDRYYMALYRKLIDPGLNGSSKQAMFLNLVFKSMKKDLVTKRIQAFVKRLLQVCCYQTPTFICGTLVLLSEVLKSKKDVLNLSKVEEDSDDEDEHFVDAPDEDSNESEVEKEEPGTSGQSVKASWVHRSHLGVKSDKGDYDPFHRNPLYCQADIECVWELQRLAQHYHPTVALFASNILKGLDIKYTGDPLQDFTLIRFLDRFVYRNPKKKDSDTTQSTVGVKQYVPTGIKTVPVNSEAFLKNQDNVPVDERFFYKYFKMKADKAPKKVDDFDSDAESVDDEEFDEFLSSHEAGIGGADDFKMDFAGELAKQKATKRGNKPDDSDDDESEDDLNLSDEDVSFSDDEDLKAAFGEFDYDIEDAGIDEDVAFSDDDFMDLDGYSTGKSKKRKGSDDFDDESLFAPKKSPKKKRESTENLFAAAEEFAHLIDDNAGSKFDMTGSNAVSNRDKADVKQLKWEADRDRWMKGNDWKSKKSHKRSKKKSGKR